MANCGGYMKNAFEHLIVIGRPACGKSEFIDFMKNRVSDEERLVKYHIAPFEEMDDFVWLWQKCEEDDIWEKMGEKRLVSTKSDHAYLITNWDLYDFLIEKFNYELNERYILKPEFYDKKTLLIEFSRGTKDAYKNALWRLSGDILKRAAILYIKVSFEESFRKNDARYKEKLKHSILAHKVPDEEMYEYYKVDDWNDLTNGAENGRLEINGIKVPFVTMNNEPEIKEPEELDKRYGGALRRLMELKNS